MKRPRGGAVRGDLAVIEACEFGRSFLHLHPQQVILNGIDGDHFDCFRNEADEVGAYQQFLEQLPADGAVFVNASCRRSIQASASAGVRSVCWRLDGDASWDWNGQILHVSAAGIRVRVRAGQRRLGDFEVPLHGQHNAENLLAAVAMASHLGLSAAQCQKSLAEFPGMGRRLEYRGVWRGMQMLDDYAHHPTAVTKTVHAVRQRFPGQRVRVLFEPHQVLRLQRCRDEFVRALSLADDVVILPVFPARERVSEATCRRISRQLAATINLGNTPAGFAESVNAAVSLVELTGQPQDVVLTMGAGTVHRIHDEVHRRFQRDSAA